MPAHILTPASKLIDDLNAHVLDYDMLQTIPDPKTLIEGVLMQETVAVLWGDPAAGKSFVTLDMAMSIATNQKWFGHKVKAGNVLYIVGEGLAGMKLRAQSWVEAKHRRPQGNEISFLSRPVQFLQDLAPEALEQLIKEKTPIRLVVVDTLARSIVGYSENDNMDMGRLIDVAEQIKEKTKATILFVHHSTKGQLRSMRGASALRGGIDTEIEMTYDEDTKQRVLHCRKQKDAIGFDPIEVHLNDYLKSAVAEPYSTKGQRAI
jgi:RecA-family ATPase